MEGLELGFEALAFVNEENVFKFRHKWFCDWVLLDYLQDVVPVCDANMFRLYADKFNIDIEQNTEEDLVELATTYRKELTLFIVDNLKTRIYDIIECWKKAIEIPGCSSIYKLPAKCRKVMLNLLMLINNTTGTDLNPQFTQFAAELTEATLAKNTYNFDRADVFEAITKDQFHTYITAIMPYVEKCFEIKDPMEFEFDIFQTKFKALVRLVKTVMLMCIPAYEMPFNEPREFFEKFIASQALSSFNDDVVARLNDLKGLTVSHAICVNEINIDVVVVHDTESLPETDAYRVVVTTLYHNAIDGE